MVLSSMSSSRRLALVVAPLLACFTDVGSAPVGDDGTSAGPGTTAPVDPTTQTSTTTGDPPDPTTSTEFPTTTTATTSAPACPGECDPGTVFIGPACGACGSLQQTCSDACELGPEVCVEPKSCGYWHLPQGAKAWERHPVDAADPHAPQAPVLAAFALPAAGQVYALTQDSYHVLTTTHTWATSGPLLALFPMLPMNAEVRSAYTVAVDPLHPDDADVTLLVGERYYLYHYAHPTPAFTYVIDDACCGPDWETVQAPAPAQVRDIWSDLANTEGWAQGDLMALCGLDEPVPVVRHLVAVTDGFVHVQDGGYCFDFFPATPYAAFTPLAYAGAPPNERFGGAAWLSGLWVFQGA